ncbi:hypothetical protein [Halapricum desulfuricans]|uniref:Uncharacterized protein n=1 Tax=Halapricum desulfuricans TaxID=2841257 RepID=A0A897N1N2_9EURY|nr:hypothetical protein [Halapricum desulfuricans]QSG06421.1 Uncharacterized protein HSR121_2090 [Halapricum desulfuricans]
MGLFDAIKSVLGARGSDESDSDSTAGEAAADTAATTDADTEPAPETESERAKSTASEARETGESDTETAEPSSSTASADTDESVGETGDSAADVTDTAGGDATDTESGFDHLTTESVDDGPDMGDDAAEFITEAETDDDAAGADPDEAETIPDEDPRAEFVEAATELADFWGEYELDFSLASLARLDDLVAEQWDAERFEDVEFGADGYDARVYTETATQLGSYFGEVLVRRHDAVWQQETGTGWTVSVPSGPDSEAAGATVTVFEVAEDCLTGNSTFTGMHDALADRLNLSGRAGDGDTPVDLDRADIETVASDAEIEDAARRLQAGAEDLAERWPEYDLDFSVESLDRLEELLESELDRDRFENVELGDDSDQESMLLTAHVVGVAGYLAEVLRRRRDADWAEQGRMVLVVEHDDSRTRIDPIEVAIAAVRGNSSLTAAVPAVGRDDGLV